jgi:hypothetical protein
MTRKKKWLILGGAGIVLAALAIFLGLRYLPWHKLMKRPTSGDKAFLTKQQGPGTAPFSLSFDFEVDPKAGIPDDIYQGIAHSGNYSTKTFGKNSFSVMIEKTIRDLNIRDMKAVALSAWVYVFPSSEEPEGSLVFTITNTVGVNTCWKGISLHGAYVPRDKWFKISGTFDLSDFQIRPDDRIQIYFWNNSDTKILSDDFYVVFGTQAPRRGDSAMVDMTRNGYQPRLNIPPFPVHLLNQEQTVNGNETGLDITPNDRIVTGRFTGSQGGPESVFVVKPDGTPALYHCCPENGFVRIEMDCSASLKEVLAGAKIMTGSFTGTGSDQLLFAGEKEIVLAGVDKAVNPCGKGPGVSLKEIWRSDGPGINGIRYNRPEAVIPCDLNGDRVMELLLVTDGGSWELLRFSTNGWTGIAKGSENRMGEWDDKYYDFTITAGPFIKGSSQDQLLTVFNEKSKPRYNYSLVRFNAAEKKFVKALPGREGTAGLTVGHDTLKPGDRFFFGRFHPGGGTGFLRYNRDWRFDLKEMEFNDSTFVILENVDFTGYEKDQNPKYFEVLKLVPGRITDPSITSLMVIARNCKDPNYHGGDCREWENNPNLPNTLRIYSFKPKTQP